MPEGRGCRILRQRAEPHTIIIAKGDRVRHFSVRPWAVALTTAIASTLLVGSIGAATYYAYIVREDLIESAAVREARIQDAYEDRIASLKAELARITTGRNSDQKLAKAKVDELLEQQVELTEHYTKLQPMLAHARRSGLLATPVPIPQPRPIESQAKATFGTKEGGNPALFPGRRERNNATSRPSSKGDRVLQQHSDEDETNRVRERILAAFDTSGPEATPNAVIGQVADSIDHVAERQLSSLRALKDGAFAATRKIASAFRGEGIDLLKVGADEGMGGPYVPANSEDHFEATYEALDEALDQLSSLKREAQRLPVRPPLRDFRLTSSFGGRTDPFVGRAAMHTGMDLAAGSGTTISAPAEGKVIRAGWNGGYGKMVEIDHGDGIVTRFAHMSRISVKVGQAVQAGERVGAVGSTGRSTGPHLHYEVRRDGEAVDPARFLRIGNRIASLL